TAHNSLVLNLQLAEMIETLGSAGADDNLRKVTVLRLREKVRDEFLVGVDWKLVGRKARRDTATTPSQNTSRDSENSSSGLENIDPGYINVYKKLHSRGAFTTERIVGTVNCNPKQFVTGFLDFGVRAAWEGGERGGLNSGVTVEVICTAEGIQVAEESKYDEEWGVNLTNVPTGMPIAKLLDRSEELNRLTQQIIESDPDGPCMRCNIPLPKWGDAGSGIEERRVCACCGIVVCTVCCSKLVFEVYTRNVLKICPHCYRESSRVRHPIEVVESNAVNGLKKKDNTGYLSRKIDASTSSSATSTSSSSANASAPIKTPPRRANSPTPPTSSSPTPPSSFININKVVQPSSFKPDGLAQDFAITPPLDMYQTPLQSVDDKKHFRTSLISNTSHNSNSPSAGSPSFSAAPPLPSSLSSKGDGSTVEDISESELHHQDSTAEPIFANWDETNPLGTLAEECHETLVAQKRALSADGKGGDDMKNIEEEYMGSSTGKEVNGKLGGVMSDPTLEASSRSLGVTRIIYRTSHSTSPSLFTPRETCCLQDSFVDEEGIAYVYEISVLHKKVFGCSGHTTAEVLFLAHIARPDPQENNQSILSVISQVDNKTGGLPDWLGNIIPDSSKNSSIAFEGLARELQEAKRQHAKLMNLDEEEDMGEVTLEGDASIDDFELLAVLGRGGFGKVMMVRHKTDLNVYAMKVLKKAELLRRRQVERTRTERHILEKATGHPFMVSLAYAFQTQHKLYMVMDFVQGGDFFTFLRKVGRMKESWAQLYVCEIALALQALHDIDVVYRDLKPENVLMERDGHVKITDFGLSRSFEMRDALPDDREKGRGAMGYTTRSFCGTEQYMSPEMLLQKGHTKAVDWWCLGLLMHEMLTGRHPFHGGTHYDTLKNMVSRPPNLDGRLSDSAKSLLFGLLTKDSTKRYGCSPLGAKELQVHRFFSGLNWNKVMRKEIPAPYIPPVGNVADTSNFEDVFTKEKAVDSVVAATSTGEQRGWLGGFFSAIKGGGGQHQGGKNKNKVERKGPKKGGNDKRRMESLSEFNDFGFKADKERIDKIGKSEKVEGEESEGGEGGGEGGSNSDKVVSQTVERPTGAGTIIFEFTDKTGTISEDSDYPLNLWTSTEPLPNVESCLVFDSMKFQDMHDGDVKNVELNAGGQLTMGQEGVWSLTTQVDPITCQATVDFSKSDKPDQPPVPLIATVIKASGETSADPNQRVMLVFTDPSGELNADPMYPLNIWEAV
ncbi:hypothetical protein TrRE_jg1735, partial [Triparma retinervis]